MPIPPVHCFLQYTASSLWLLLLPVKPLKMLCSQAQVSLEMVDNEDKSFMGRRKLEEIFFSVSYIRINNTISLFFKPVCQAYLSEHISHAVQSTYPHVLVHCPSAVSVLADCYRENH